MTGFYFSPWRLFILSILLPQAVDIKLLGSLKRDDLKKICGDNFPEWISFPEYEQVGRFFFLSFLFFSFLSSVYMIFLNRKRKQKISKLIFCFKSKSFLTKMSEYDLMNSGFLKSHFAGLFIYLFLLPILKEEYHLLII